MHVNGAVSPGGWVRMGPNSQDLTGSAPLRSTPRTGLHTGATRYNRRDLLPRKLLIRSQGSSYFETKSGVGKKNNNTPNSWWRVRPVLVGEAPGRPQGGPGACGVGAQVM